jgi:hypothetical protein
MKISHAKQKPKKKKKKKKSFEGTKTFDKVKKLIESLVLFYLFRAIYLAPTLVVN